MDPLKPNSGDRLFPSLFPPSPILRHIIPLPPLQEPCYTGQRPVNLFTDRDMNAITLIAASEAKARFSEYLLDRAGQGEGFAITLPGQLVAKLVPAKPRSLSDIQSAILELKSKRIVLNPPGIPKIRIRDLINEGRP